MAKELVKEEQPKKKKNNPTWHALVWRAVGDGEKRLEILERKNSLELRRAIAEDQTIESVHLVFRGRIMPFKKTISF